MAAGKITLQANDGKLLSLVAPEGMSGDTTGVVISTGTIHNATSKTNPVDADEIGILDSANSFSLKKLTWANLKNTLGSLFAPLVSPALTGTPTVNGVAFSGYSGFKNYIINGNFDVWQRGASGVSTGQPYTADMWKVWASGANTNWSRAASTDFNSYTKFVGWGLKWNGDPASNNSPIEHRIESINAYKLSGKKVTLSFLAKCSANSNLSVEIGLANAIDNFSTVANISSQIVNLTTTTQKFIVTFDLTDKDVRNGINLVFRPSTPANIHWIAQVQLEEGSVATPFEQRPYGLELSLCQRYYQKIADDVSFTADNAVFGAYQAGNLYPLGRKYLLPVPMRISPTVQYAYLATGYTGGTPTVTANSTTLIISLNSSITGCSIPYIYVSGLTLSAEL